MPTRAEALEFARTLIKTPFHHQGRLPGVGLDCIGAVLVPMWHFGITDEDIRGYSRQPDPTELYGHLRRFRKAGTIWIIPKDHRLPMDAGLMRIASDPQHFVWFTDTGILHCSNDRGVIEHRMSRGMENDIVAVYRIRGICG